jgi:hypothetical protein
MHTTHSHTEPLDEMVKGYLEQQLATGLDELYPDADNDIPADLPDVDREQHGQYLDHYYGIGAIDREYAAGVRAGISAFVDKHPRLVKAYLEKYPANGFGADLLLTRNREGAGFWDLDLGMAGDLLTERAHALGESAGLVPGVLCSDPTGGGRVFQASKLYPDTNRPF